MYYNRLFRHKYTSHRLAFVYIIIIMGIESVLGPLIILASTIVFY